MKLFMNTFETTTLNMGVDLCSGYIRMPQHELDRAEISTVFQKMGGKGMPESMGVDILANVCLSGNIFQYLPITVSCQGPTLPGYKK
mgnify:CR=1 FL=1